jgi:hypothetical protein
MSSPDVPTKFDVITELSAGVLPEIMHTYGVDKGKFVRFGTLILLGPATPIQPDGLSIAHLDIASAASEHPDAGFRQRVQAAVDASDPAQNIGADYRGMLDAGLYAFSLTADSAVESVTFTGGSSTFQRSFELRGRGETADLARIALGPGVNVQAV